MTRRSTGTAWFLGGMGGFASGLCGLLAGVGNSAGNAALGAQEEHVYYPGKWQFVADLLTTSNQANQLAMLWGAAALAMGATLFLYVRYGAGLRTTYLLGAAAAGILLAVAGYLMGSQLDTLLYPYL